MATQFEIDCALMAGRAYQLSRSELNFFPVPVGWTEFFHVPNDTYPTTLGFEAVSFQRGSEIVISYAGTNPTSLNDWIANITLGAGFSSSQLEQAALYYLQVKQANPTATISFTGHSLGGGLASLMAVFFDQQAVTFDQAPFESSSSSTIRDNLESFLNSNGYSDSLLTTLVPEFMSYGGYRTRTANVTGYYMEGEALQLLQPLQPPLGVIGTQAALSQSGTGLDILGIDLHSQTLLTAFLLNDAFRDITFKLPDLLKTLFDKTLYARSTEPGPNAQRNFLENLLHELKGSASINFRKPTPCPVAPVPVRGRMKTLLMLPLFICSGGLVYSYQIDIGVTPSPVVGGADHIEGGIGDDAVCRPSAANDSEWRIAA